MTEAEETQAMAIAKAMIEMIDPDKDDIATAAALDAEAKRLFGPPLPTLALSVRQPWAWAIIHGGKDVENRTRAAIVNGNMPTAIGQRIAIHAGIGMTQDEYREALVTFGAAGVTAPMPGDLLRGGIIGTVEVIGIARKGRDLLESPWFFGPYGLLLRRARECPFVGAKGQLGLFTWSPSGQPPQPPAKWMLPAKPKSKPTPAATAPDLFGGDP